jgi:hypothetical protein
MTYKIVSQEASWALSTAIKQAIKEGWKPQGGVAVVFYGGYKERWSQAMVKE